jgi:hypothetical protein
MQAEVDMSLSVQTTDRYEHFTELKPSWFSISDFLAVQSGAELSDKFGEVIIKNTCFQYEHS